jgi:hypothetical protein
MLSVQQPWRHQHIADPYGLAAENPPCVVLQPELPWHQDGSKLWMEASPSFQPDVHLVRVRRMARKKCHHPGCVPPQLDRPSVRHPSRRIAPAA